MSVERILDEFRACRTEQQVEAVADRYREALKLIEIDPATKVRAIHIRNMKLYMLKKIRFERAGRV